MFYYDCDGSKLLISESKHLKDLKVWECTYCDESCIVISEQRPKECLEVTVRGHLLTTEDIRECNETTEFREIAEKTVTQ